MYCLFAGVMLSEPGTVPEPAILKRLWVHEVMRVYYDRLVEDSDRAWIVSFLKETMTKVFNTSFDELFEKLDFNNDGIYDIHAVCVMSCPNYDSDNVLSCPDYDSDNVLPRLRQ